MFLTYATWSFFLHPYLVYGRHLATNTTANFPYSVFVDGSDQRSNFPSLVSSGFFWHLLESKGINRPTFVANPGKTEMSVTSRFFAPQSHALSVFNNNKYFCNSYNLFFFITLILTTTNNNFYFCKWLGFITISSMCHIFYPYRRKGSLFICIFTLL